MTDKVKEEKSETVSKLTQREVEQRSSELSMRMLCDDEKCENSFLYGDLSDEELKGAIKIAIRILRTSDGESGVDDLVWHLIREQKVREEEFSVLGFDHFGDDGGVVVDEPVKPKKRRKPSEPKSPKAKP